MNRSVIASAFAVLVVSAGAASAESCFYEEKTDTVQSFFAQDPPKQFQLIVANKLRAVAESQVHGRSGILSGRKSLPTGKLMCFGTDGIPTVLQSLETYVEPKTGEVKVKVSGL